MITEEILKEQLELYKKGRQQAIDALEKVKADINAFNGAIEACEGLLKLNEELEAAQSTETTQEPISEAEQEAAAT